MTTLSTLDNIENIERLTPEQQYLAKVVFLYIQRYCRIPYRWAPLVPFDKARDSKKLDTYYWDLVIKQYNGNHDALIGEFNSYMRCIVQNNFTRFLNFSDLEAANKESN